MRFPRRLPLAALILLAPALAGAAEFRVSMKEVAADSTYVRISFSLSDPLPEADAEGPKSSPPAALAYTVELWRDRSGWFDGLVSSRTYGYRIDYDHWRGVWRVVPPEGPVFETANRAEIVDLLCRQSEVPAARTADLVPGRKYYVAITARLTPIDINELGEAESWLSGEFRAGARGGVLGVPKAVIGVLADAAGFGDRSTVERSGHFRALDGPPWLEPFGE